MATTVVQRWCGALYFHKSQTETRPMLRSAIMMALAVVSATCAQAQTYPTRPINVIVSLAAGTGMDTLVRVYTARLSQSLGQPLVGENPPRSAGLARRAG